MTPKQIEVIEYLRTVKCATVSNIYNNVSFGYYCNQSANMGKLLARMVKTGMIERLRPGVFKLGMPKKNIDIIENDTNQKTLFK